MKKEFLKVAPKLLIMELRLLGTVPIEDIWLKIHGELNGDNRVMVMLINHQESANMLSIPFYLIRKNPHLLHAALFNNPLKTETTFITYFCI